MRILGTSLLIANALSVTAQAKAAPVRTQAEACAAVKASVAVNRHVPVSIIAFCDVIPLSEVPRGYYVLALHSDRKCEGICSTNMGWFAVNQRTSRVFKFDVDSRKVGLPIEDHR